MKGEASMKFKRLMYILVIGTLFFSFLLSGGALAAGRGNQAVCPGPARAGDARCGAWVRPFATSGPTGLSPAKIQSAYNFPTSPTAGSGKTVAIVDAYDDPTAASDLGAFDA